MNFNFADIVVFPLPKSKCLPLMHEATEDNALSELLSEKYIFSL